MLDRLLGLETEYAIGVSPRDAPLSPTNAEVYDAVREAIEALVVTQPGESSLKQIFLENGGSVSYESLPWARDGGLLEGATAESRSPGTALLHQRAQDALLVRALPDAELRLARQGRPVRLSLRKNCRDAEGNVYGAQESYECELARGPLLWAWRVGLLLLLPLALLSTIATWVVAIVAIVATVAFLLPFGLLGVVSARVRRLELWGELFSSDEGAPREGRGLERRLARPFSSIERALWAPAVRPFFWLAAGLAFRRVRRDALPFLLTRPVLTGTGTLMPDGSLGLSEKGPSIVGLHRRSVAPEDRCVWDGGNLCKSLLGLPMLRGWKALSLMHRRQRLQLGLSDSNVTQVAELLKVGTTALVLDMAEAGRLADLPRLRRPLDGLRRVIGDPELRARIPWGAEELTALQVQRRYWERARDFVRESAVPSMEAAELVELWGRTLDGLERDPATQVGRVDWVTKRFLLETAGDGEPWEVRKAIDLKMHELGPEGWLHGLEADGLAPRLVSEEEVERAMREPPADSPAQRRSRLIRELREQDVEVKVYWDRVRVGGRLRGRVIRLDQYRDRDRDRSTDDDHT
ncbi:proteasome accessory factor PafA2 family protein [Paraliomyxa miuraensis]|uniref:proteasome accessory factor PafA2 family protein n=1 Tax=Paraliomyxa miuraensis TaxID=376150 RepID=UPI002259B3A9|nr:proteasome accessory factor PafA2 family protein [Paraliomyxa miuraensis]MCX4240888.1 proteasome accessory factor PafA2 family protein [Paraliomyxa miuraensis]